MRSRSAQIDPVCAESLPAPRRPVTVGPAFGVQACGRSSRDVGGLVVDEEELLGREPKVCSRGKDISRSEAMRAALASFAA